MSAEEGFDLQAAGLRADGAELAVSVEVIAAKLEGALPAITSVERHRVGGFRSKRQEVRRIAISLGDEQFELKREDQRLQCTQNKVVRGITLSRRELPLSEWIAGLVAGVNQSASLADQDRQALEELLG